jgi:integrase
MTLEDFAVEWLNGRTDLARRTDELYTFLLSHHILDDLGHFPLNELRTSTLRDWQQRRLRQGAGPVTLAKAITLLKQILEEAVAAEHMQRNPATSLQVHKPEKRIPVPATPEQIEAMRDWFLAKDPPHLGDATLISVLGYGGLRPGEALALRWSDIDHGTISVTKAIAYGEEKGTKTGATRVVRPPSVVGRDLAEWKLATPAPFGLIFPRKTDGEPWTRHDWNNWRRRRFGKAARAAGLEGFRPYDMRHSAASLLIAENRPITEVAAQLGHSPAVCLSVYAHVMEQARDKESVSAESWIAEARSQRQEAASG